MSLQKPQKVLAIIGARSGSKGVPHKNVRHLCGRPLMAYIIDAAKNSHYVNRIVVCTDSEEYAKIAQTHGAEAPYIQPAHISKGHSTDYEYTRYALEWLEQNKKYIPDVIVRLMPTVPLQSAEDIDGCIEELLSHPDADSAMVVAEARQPPNKALKITPEGRLVSYLTGDGKGTEPTKREAYEKAYFRANVIATYPRIVKEKRSLAGEHVRCYVIPQERAIDIDTEIDFFIAEQLLQKLQIKNRPN